MRLVHVAVIGLRGIPDVMGGIESHCAELLPRLLAQVPPDRLRVTVLARSGYVAAPSRHKGVEQTPLWAPRHGALETIVHSVLALFHARFVLRADCVHLHGVGPGLTAPLARLLGLSLLFTHHGEDYRRRKWGRVARLALRLGETLAVRFSHRVIAVSRSSTRRLQQGFPNRADRIVHIPNGVPPDARGARPAPPPEDLGVTPGHYVITVGRMVPEKAQDVLIAAYRQTDLSRRSPPCRLLIVGDADHQSDYAATLRAQAGDGVIFAGRLPREQVMALNRGASLFVLPSDHEGLSIAALEAIQAGAPILLSDIEANRDLGLPSQHYFATGSADDLARKLTQPFAHYAVPPDFDQDSFDWDRIAARTLRELAALPHPGAPLVPVAAQQDGGHG